MSRYRQPYSLVKRGKYYYYRTYDIKGIRTPMKTTGCTSKSAAREYCDKLFLAGMLNVSRATFGEYSIHFFDDDSPFCKDRIKPLAFNSLNNYRSQYRNYIYPYFHKTKIADINYSALKTFRTKLSETKSPASVQLIMNTLRPIILMAYKDGLIPSNPFEFLENYKQSPNKRDAFTLEEIKQIYNTINPRYKDFILLIALTGFRKSEAIGIAYNEVIESPQKFKYIDVKKQLCMKKLSDVKSGSHRLLPVIPEILNLKTIPSEEETSFFYAFDEVRNKIKDYESRKLAIHSLRHFFITNAKSYGIPDSKVEYLAGHKLPGIQSVYTNYKAEDVIEILEWQKKIYHDIVN